MSRFVVGALALGWIGALCAGCESAEDRVDGAAMDAATPGSDAAVEGDGGTHMVARDGAVSDAGGGERDADGCLIATIGEWSVRSEDDVSIIYQAPVTPSIDGNRHNLWLMFNRYDVPYVGAFDLDSGRDSNFGSCARCVAAFTEVSGGDYGFFVDRGTLTMSADPFDRTLNIALQNARLIEVTIESVDSVPTSVPVEGGECISLTNLAASQTFPPEGWRCDASEYRDNTTCNCGCGAFDPDCGPRCDLADPGCDPLSPPPPLPQMGCMAGELCGVGGECLTGCDHAGRVGCTDGLCGFGADGDRCYTGGAADRIDAAGLGEACGAGNFFCNPRDGFIDGMCDDLDGNICKPVCDELADCDVPAGEICVTVFGDNGYCRPPAPIDG